jgi:hypothetical protein
MEGARSWKVFCFQKITNIKISNLRENKARTAYPAGKANT